MKITKSLTHSIILLTLSTNSMAQALKNNDVAPALEVTSVQGMPLDLNDYQGKTVLLSFFRFAGCPVCNMRMHELMKNQAALQAKGVEVIAVFESSGETLAEYLKDASIPFPLVSDTSLALYRRYGADEKSLIKMIRTMTKQQAKADMKIGETLYQGKTYPKDGSMTRIPADFLIENGSIKRAYYGRYIGDHIPLQELLQ
ncbi:MAG: AhpC/TSA family protein [Cytophagales bacterium]|nr:AhpC/TSA family protein [Cytophagales bacterium]